MIYPIPTGGGATARIPTLVCLLLLCKLVPIDKDKHSSPREPHDMRFKEPPKESNTYFFSWTTPGHSDGEK